MRRIIRILSPRAAMRTQTGDFDDDTHYRSTGLRAQGAVRRGRGFNAGDAAAYGGHAAGGVAGAHGGEDRVCRAVYPLEGFSIGGLARDRRSAVPPGALHPGAVDRRIRYLVRSVDAASGSRTQRQWRGAGW